MPRATRDHRGVQEFQTRLHTICGLAVDGIVGPMTWHALENPLR